MAADDGDYYPTTPDELYDVQIWKWYYTVTVAALVYDWAITFDKEVQHIWMRRRSGFTWLWIVLRYLPMIGISVAGMSVYQTTWEPEKCGALATVPTVFVIALVIISHFFFILRTYALYGRSRLILYIFCPALVIETAILIWTAMNMRQTHLPKGFGCIPASPRFMQGVIHWVAPFVFDTLIFGFTLHRSIQYIRSHRNVQIVHVIIRDGVVYFGIMSIAYVTNIFLYASAPIGLHDMNAAFSTAITVICTQRIIFNMREVPAGDSGESVPTLSRMSYLSQPTLMVRSWVDRVERALDRQHERIAQEEVVMIDFENSTVTAARAHHDSRRDAEA